MFELLTAADAVILSSSWENFPHAVVEGLAAGTPVIATDVGGVGEVLTDGVNGLLVPHQDAAALAGAIRRFFADEELRARLRAAARGSIGDYAPRANLRPDRGVAARGRLVKPRLLMVGRMRYRLPLDDSLRLKFDALRRVFDVRVVATGVAGSAKRDEVFALAGPFRPRGSTVRSSSSRSRSGRRASCGERGPTRSSSRAPTRHGWRCSGAGSPAFALRSSSTFTATGARPRGCTARPHAGC